MVRRTKEEAQITRNRILDMAEQEFLRRGVSRTSLQDIASAAGLTRGAIYWHFQDKADLFNAMMSRVKLPLEAAMERSGNPDLQPLAHIRASCLEGLRVTVTDAQARRVFEIASLKAEYTAELQAVQDRILTSLRDRVGHMERCLQRATQLGHYKGRIPAHAAALGLQALMGGLIRNWMLDPAGSDLQRVGRQAIDSYLRGINSLSDSG